MSKRKTRRGRPTTEPKGEFLGVRVTARQMRFLRRQARRYTLTVGDVVRGIIEEELRRIDGDETWSAFAGRALGKKRKTASRTR